jgi:hypothetical protein
MELYEHRDSDKPWGRTARGYGVAALLVGGIAGAGWFVLPWILAAWKDVVIPLVESFRLAIGV